jgi:hypothetical protein
MTLTALVGIRWPNSANKPAQQLLYKTIPSHEKNGSVLVLSLDGAASSLFKAFAA